MFHDLHTLPTITFGNLPEGHYFIDCGDDGIPPDWGLNCYLKLTHLEPQLLMDFTGQHPVEFGRETYVIDLGTNTLVVEEVEAMNAVP